MNFKKRTNFLFGVLLLTGSLLAQNVCVSTPKTSLVLSAPEGGTLRHLYYGNRLSEADLQNISAAEANHAAYPEYGLNAPVETALAVKHADGNMTLQLEVLNVTTEKEGNAVTTVVALKDKVYPFFVNVCYRAWQDADVIGYSTFHMFYMHMYWWMCRGHNLLSWIIIYSDWRTHFYIFIPFIIF